MGGIFSPTENDFSIILHSLHHPSHSWQERTRPHFLVDETTLSSTAMRKAHRKFLIFVQNHPSEMPGKTGSPFQGQQIIEVSTTLPKAPLGIPIGLLGLSQHRVLRGKWKSRGEKVYPGVKSLLSLIKQSLEHILKHKNLKLSIHLCSYPPQVTKKSDKPHKYQLWVSIPPGEDEHHGQFFLDIQELTHIAATGV